MSIVILGGGMTGLSAAAALRRRGRHCLILERRDAAGGCVQSLRDGPWLHESGPNSILAEPGGAAWTLIREAGLESRVLRARAGGRRFVVRRGVPVPVPATPRQFLGSPLFSAAAKLRLLAEPLRRRADPAREESVSGFVRRRLGDEFLDYAVEPLVGGIYAGDPDQLSVGAAFPRLAALERKHGSLIVGALRRHRGATAPKGEIVSFPEGLAELPASLAALLGEDLRCGVRVLDVAARAGGWEVRFQSGTGERRVIAAEAVVCALSLPALACLPVQTAEGRCLPFSGLAATPIAPVASVALGYLRDQVAHPLDGFGVLLPRREGRNILGVLFSSSLFPGRAPDGCVALTAFAGGLRQPGIAALDDAALVRVVEGELQELLGVRGGPVHVSVIRHPLAIPQYDLGHAARLGACVRAESRYPGLFFGGNVRDGISLTACMAAGERLAAAAMEHVAADASARAWPTAAAN